MPKTIRLYYFDTFKTTHRATVTCYHAENNSVELDETIFHPQGGGQPSDQGTIGGIEVAKVVDTPDRQGIFHILKTAPTFKVGDKVDLEVNPESRLYFSRLHSAGHLIANIVEAEFPEMKAVQGHHFPGEARVDFAFAKQPELLELQTKLVIGLKKQVAESAEVVSEFDDKFGRTIKMGEFNASACGGTHVASLDQIGEVILRGAKIVKDKAKGETRIRLGYNLTP